MDVPKTARRPDARHREGERDTESRVTTLWVFVTETHKSFRVLAGQPKALPSASFYFRGLFKQKTCVCSECRPVFRLWLVVVTIGVSMGPAVRLLFRAEGACVVLCDMSSLRRGCGLGTFVFEACLEGEGGAPVRSQRGAFKRN